MEREEDLRARAEESSSSARGLRRHFCWHAGCRTVLQVIACLAVCLPLAGAAFGEASSGVRQIRKEVAVRVVKGLRITPVEGESWLRHLGIPFIASNMGRVANWAPSPPGLSERPSSGEGPDGDFLLSGADLYRLNCQSWHNAV